MFLSKPGGFCCWLGTFFVQFYQNPFMAALIVTLFSFALFLVSTIILSHYRIKGILWSMIPVIFLAALQSHHLYLPETTAGLLISLSFFALYISVLNHNYRYLSGFIGCSLLYFISGGLAFLAFILCIIHELIFSTAPKRFIVSLGYIILSILIPLISSKLVYYVKTEEIWLYLIPFHLKKSLHPFIYSILLYYPLLLIISKFRSIITKKESQAQWNLKTMLAGIIITGSLIFCIAKFVYDKKTEILLSIDYNIQNGQWNKALENSFKYPGSNQLILYLGNMAMYKTGQMGDKMFHLPQVGIHGLWLEWKRNEVAPFLGGEVFYQLGYISEAYRWAFEAMVAIGQNPRSLKRLVITSIIRDDVSVAQHYINILNKTLFYRKWAQRYQKFLDNPDLLVRDKEIMEKRHFEMHTDILASLEGRDIGLLKLLQDHPDNRMAFEYYMASLMLNKDLDAFASNVYRLGDLGYSYIPVHYEEAMLAYMDHTKKNIVPAGYSISRETLMRLSGYLEIYNSTRDRNSAARSLYKEYGGTYWFYMNFVNAETR